MCLYSSSLQLAKLYGNVYNIFLGTKPVMLNSISALKEAFVNKSSDFSDRADNLFVRRAIHSKGWQLLKALLISFETRSDLC